MDKQLIYDFVGAINEHNVDKICSLMTDDHKFIDSHGNEAVGKEQMRSGWIGYFQMFPDYKIEIIEIVLNGDTIAAFGFAGGTFKGLSDKKENYWHLPAAWKAIINDGKIQLWQVYADSKIPFDIINKNKLQ
jgi:ketosteroid isomerase-like protein